MFEKMIPTDIFLVLIVTTVQVKGPIIKTNEQWLCDYCAMGENCINIIIVSFIFPQDLEKTRRNVGCPYFASFCVFSSSFSVCFSIRQLRVRGTSGGLTR